ncbi:hypothetical protein NMY22_g12928 [Coprinellus aureogranulatus]|nr:hypothetical protein NMY22_g12928 [Coprinellus aureogranulatus]
MIPFSTQRERANLLVGDREILSGDTLIPPPNSITNLLVLRLFERRFVVLGSTTHALLDEVDSFVEGV